jgi:hypothetical protein
VCCVVAVAQVQQALQEVSQQPWKIVKYLFNKDVMGAIKVGASSLHTPALLNTAAFCTVDTDLLMKGQGKVQVAVEKRKEDVAE